MGLSVDDVIAHAVYDPVARRQRYLKGRQLKGRQKGTQAAPGPRDGPPTAAPSPSKHINRTQVQQSESSARQVAEIRGKLTKLKAHLQELLAQKKSESTGSSDSKSSTSSSSKAGGSKSPPKTAKQKAAAKEALKKAQKERAKDAKKSTPTLDEQITRARAVITDVEAKLRAAIDSARTQTASNGR